MKTLLPLLAVLLTSSSAPLREKFAIRPSPEVTFKGEYLLFLGIRFTGILQESFPAAGIIRKTHYVSGLQDGVQEEFYSNGKLAARREYSRGLKVGTHEGWYENGGRRYLYDYRNGVQHGEAWEWYGSGKLALYALFEKGQLLGKKVWRETGQIYMNYVFPNGQAFGTPGTKLCYQVRGKRTSR